MLKDVIIFLPNLRGGGAEKVSVTIANNLHDRGYKVTMLLMSVEGEFLEHLHSGIEIVDLKAKRLMVVPLKLARLLREKKPFSLMVHMWDLTLVSVVGKLLSLQKTRIISVDHNTLSRTPAFYNRKIFGRFLIKQGIKLSTYFCHKRIGVSEGVLNDTIQLLGKKLPNHGVIYNPVIDSNNEGVSIKYPEDITRKARKLILNVGALEFQKNQKLLIEAFARVVETVPVDLVILGEGSKRIDLESQVERLNLTDYVSIPGFVPNVKDYYTKADLFVLSSEHEGLPTVLIEALSYGVPCVSTDCPSGPAEILTNQPEKYGFIVPLNDPIALADSMKKAIEKTYDQDELKIRANFFSVDTAIDEYIKATFL